MGRVGPYQLQAAIAAVHDEAPTAADTDWAQILGLYEVLARVAPSPVVALNRAVALAEVAGPEAGLAAVDALAGDPSLAEYRFFHSTRADFLRRLGRWGEAADAYGRALALAENGPERAFLERRIARGPAAGSGRLGLPTGPSFAPGRKARPAARARRAGAVDDRPGARRNALGVRGEGARRSERGVRDTVPPDRSPHRSRRSGDADGASGRGRPR